MDKIQTMKHYWGIDLGGTKIEGVVLDETYKPLARLRLPTEQEKGYEHIVQQIGKVVDLLKQETNLEPTQIGIGTPGAINPKTQLLKNSNTLCLNGQPLHLDLEKLLNLPIKIANDANCFALAEAVMGIVPDELPNARMVFGVIMGTGCGGGLVIDTPGMRTLHVSDVSVGLDVLFAEIVELAPQCRFRDCTHAHEPGCAVQAQIAAGTLDPARATTK